MQCLPGFEANFLEEAQNNLIPLGGISRLLPMERTMQETLTLSIEGMHCGACVRRATTALQRVAGVRLNSVDVGSAKMSFNSEQATAGEIVGALDRIGFVAHIEK
jgi:copper chaperone